MTKTCAYTIALSWFGGGVFITQKDGDTGWVTVISLCTTFQTVYLVSLAGFFFKPLSFVQTKGTDVLTCMFFMYVNM